jgi:hypothetical protein
MELGGGYPEQEEADADFEKRSGEYIENLAEEPVLKLELVGIRDVCRMSDHTVSAVEAREGSRSSMCRPVP